MSELLAQTYFTAEQRFKMVLAIYQFIRSNKVDKLHLNFRILGHEEYLDTGWMTPNQVVGLEQSQGQEVPVINRFYVLGMQTLQMILAYHDGLFTPEQGSSEHLYTFDELVEIGKKLSSSMSNIMAQTAYKNKLYKERYLDYILTDERREALRQQQLREEEYENIFENPQSLDLDEFMHIIDSQNLVADVLERINHPEKNLKKRLLIDNLVDTSEVEKSLSQFAKILRPHLEKFNIPSDSKVWQISRPSSFIQKYQQQLKRQNTKTRKETEKYLKQKAENRKSKHGLTYVEPFDFASSYLFNPRNYLLSDTKDFASAIETAQKYRSKLLSDMQMPIKEFTDYERTASDKEYNDIRGIINPILNRFTRRVGDSIIISKANLSAYTIFDELAKKIINKEQFPSQVIFLMGNPGVGKTYLVSYFAEALINYGVDSDKIKHFVFRFQNTYSHAAKEKLLAGLTDNIMENHVTIIDEFSSMMSSGGAKSYIFNLIDTIKEYNNRVLIIVSSLPYEQLFTHDEMDVEMQRLKSRSDECLRVEISLPDTNLRRRFIEDLLKPNRSLVLTPEQKNKVVLASKNSDFRAIRGFFNNTVSTENFDANIEKHFKFSEMSVKFSSKQLFEIVCAELGHTLEDLFARNRSQKFVFLRNVCTCILRINANLTYNQIAEIMELGTSTLQAHAQKCVKQLEDTESRMYKVVSVIQKQVNDIIENRPKSANLKGDLFLTYPLTIPTEIES
ncbi:DnaA ATPase domain-containing protein [Psittacicella hinzii]